MYTVMPTNRCLPTANALNTKTSSQSVLLFMMFCYLKEEICGAMIRMKETLCPLSNTIFKTPSDIFQNNS